MEKTKLAEGQLMDSIGENWYWCEASGAVAHLCEKYGGDKIPSLYASEILGVEDIVIKDGYTYERSIAESHWEKTIFRLKDESIFNKVVDYQKRRLKHTVEYIISEMNKVNEAMEDEAQKADNEALLACNIIISISDTMCEMMSSELIPEQVAYLKQSIETLQKYPNYKNAERSIHLGQYMIDNYTIFKLNKF